MIALIQRVNWAQVHIDSTLHADIDMGLLALIGIEKDDDDKLAQNLVEQLLCKRARAA